jgi:glycosyltransferase involved in cell wall biosynthesis
VRALFLTHYFPPEVGAPQTRIAALAAGLRAHGIETAVHTGFPHYPDGGIAAPYRNRPLKRERLADGMPVLRSAVFPAASAGTARRLLDHAAFAASATLTAAAAAAADVIVVESPPLLLAAAAPLYGALRGAPVVLNVADLWPDTAIELGALRNRRAIAAARALEAWAYRRAAAITVPTSGMAAALERRPEAGGRVHQLGPAVDLERFARTSPPDPGPRLRVLYAGTVGVAQGLRTLLEAARIAGPNTVEVTIAGSGADAAALRGGAAGLSHVRMLGTVPAGQVPELYARADVAVVLLRDRPLFEQALPTKLLEALAAARPIVLSARGEAADLVRAAGSGVVVAPEDPPELAAALVALARDSGRRREMGMRGRACAEARFDRRASVERWAALLRRVAQGARR